MSKWKPIDIAPSNQNVLLYCPYMGVSNEERIELGYAKSGWREGPYSTMSQHSWATHWMPLPVAPDMATKLDAERTND